MKQVKKIGTITFHNSYNYGSVLQAFALQTYLEKEEEEIAKKKNLTNEIIERMKQKNGCH